MSIEELKANIAEKERNLAAMEEDDESYAAAKAEVDALKQELAKAEKGDDTNNTSDKKDDIEAIVEERLAKMKANMDRMAKERDEAKKKQFLLSFKS